MRSCRESTLEETASTALWPDLTNCSIHELSSLRSEASKGIETDDQRTLGKIGGGRSKRRWRLTASNVGGLLGLNGTLRLLLFDKREDLDELLARGPNTRIVSVEGFEKEVVDTNLGSGSSRSG